MKIFSVLTVALLMIFQTVGFAATGTFSASGEYLMSDYDTPEIAEEIALDFAKQSAAEQAGVYLESYSRSVNFELEADEIKTVASSKVEVQEKNISRQFQRDGRILLRADIRAKVDTSELDNFIKQEREQRQRAIQQYKDLQKMNAKIKQDIETFQAKLAVIKDEVKDDDLIVEQERINREFLAKQKSEEFGKELDASKDFSFNIEHLEEAIKLQPKLSWLYIEYGVFKSIGSVGNIEAAIFANPESGDKVVAAMAPDIKEINKAIILAPNEAQPYMMRGVHYSAFGESKQLAGRNAEAKKYFDKALKDYNKAVELAPKDAWSYIGRGGLYRDCFNDYDKALADYNTSIKLNPKNGYAYKDRGDLYKELKKYPEAAKDYQLALKFNPETFGGFDYNKLGKIYKELKDYPRALEIYTRSIELKPKFAFADHRPSAYNDRAELYVALGEFDKAVADCDAGIELATVVEDDNFWLVMLKSTKREALEAKEKSEKEKAFADKYDKIDSKNTEALLERADKYSAKSEYELAIKDYTRVLKLAPKNQLALYKRSKAYFYMDEYHYNLALDDVNKLIKLNPQYDDGGIFGYGGIYNHRGLIYEHLGEYDKALADIDKALEFSPDSKILESNRQRILNKINPNREITDVKELIKRADYYGIENFDVENKDYNRAIEIYTKALELEPDNQDVYFKRGLTYFYLKRYDLALADYNKLLELNPNRGSTAYNNRGAAYKNLGDYEKAIADYSRAIEINAEDKLYFKNRGDCYQKLKDYPRAIEDYTQAIVLDPNYQDAYFQRALMYLTLKNFEPAIADYTKVLETLDESNPDRDIERWTRPKYYSLVYTQRGLAYENLGELDKALADYDKALELNPSNDIAKKSRQRVLDNTNK